MVCPPLLQVKRIKAAIGAPGFSLASPPDSFKRDVAAIIGGAMRRSQGRANPQLLSERVNAVVEQWVKEAGARSRQ